MREVRTLADFVPEKNLLMRKVWEVDAEKSPYIFVGPKIFLGRPPNGKNALPPVPLPLALPKNG